MPKTAAHLVETRWEPGKSGNPVGRPKGSRSKLNEEVLKYLYEDFNQHGKATIVRVRERKPEMYLAAVVSLLPKQQQKIESPFIDLTDEELALLETFLASSRAKLVQQITPSGQPDEPDDIHKHAALREIAEPDNPNEILHQADKRAGRTTATEAHARSNTKTQPNNSRDRELTCKCGTTSFGRCYVCNTEPS